jgi:hypothetical protein
VAGDTEAERQDRTLEPSLEGVFVEPRWPVARTVSTFIAISLLLRIAVPNRESLGPHWVVPGIEIGLLICLLAADPARLTGHRRWLRRLSIALVLALAAATLAATGIQIRDLITGGKVTNQAGSLLASGVLIWLGNVLVFSLIYWLLDSGGPLARYLHERPYPDFAFSQQLSPELAPPNWRPATATTSSSPSPPAPPSAQPTSCQ